MEQQFVVKGGMCNKPYVLDTMPVLVSGEERHFCRIVKSETWLLKCGAGAGAQKGILKRSKVIEQLKDKPADASPNMTQGSAVAAHAPAVADDPMSALDEVEEKESPTKNEVRSKTLGQYCLPDRDAPTTARDGRGRSCGPSQSKCLGKIDKPALDRS